MPDHLTVTVIGDRDPADPLHAALDAALGHAADRLGVALAPSWAPTARLARDLAPVERADALACATASNPFDDMDGVLAALRYGRERGVPTFGGCGGCQLMIVEFARGVLGVRDAQHAEYDAGADELVVTPLACSLAGTTGTVALAAGSRAAAIYGVERTREPYFCTFGLAPDYERRVEAAGLRISGRDAGDGSARIFELADHPFSIATLFVPQARSTPTHPHPVLLALLAAARDRQAQPVG